MKRKW